MKAWICRLLFILLKLTVQTVRQYSLFGVWSKFTGGRWNLNIYAPAPHPLLQALHNGGHVSQPVLLILLHLQLELLLGHAAEVAVLLHGFQHHFALVLPLLSQGQKYLRLLGLEEEERWAAERMSQRATLNSEALIYRIPPIDFPLNLSVSQSRCNKSCSHINVKHKNVCKRISLHRHPLMACTVIYKIYCMFDLQYWTSGVKKICQTVLLIVWLICWWVAGFVSYLTDCIDIWINEMQELASVRLDFSCPFCRCSSQCDAQLTKQPDIKLDVKGSTYYSILLTLTSNRVNLSFCIGSDVV